jgi:hypothetical protein
MKNENASCPGSKLLNRTSLRKFRKGIQASRDTMQTHGSGWQKNNEGTTKNKKINT